MKRLYSSKEWQKLKELTTEQKMSGKKLVFTNGCFDILHKGHLALLEFVHDQGGFTVVGLNSDASVGRLKGNGRPVNNMTVRAENLMRTGLINAVAVYENDTPQEITDFLEPDILVKGDDYSFETTVGAPEVAARGGKVLFFKKIPGLSTTNIIKIIDKNS